MKINRLYSPNNELFEPIKFESGFNFILGDKSEGSDKRNGVGKTISVEFINFMLLGDLSKSRLGKIPKKVYKDMSIVCLDLEISGKELTIQRNLNEPNEVAFIEQGFTQNLDLSLIHI